MYMYTVGELMRKQLQLWLIDLETGVEVELSSKLKILRVRI